MLLIDVTETGSIVAATTKRGEKTTALAELLKRTAAAEIAPLIGFLVGEPRQGAIGSGWAAVNAIDASAADLPSIAIGELGDFLSELQATTGPGSQQTRATKLHAFFRRATSDEQDYLRRLIVGELRQGALAGLVTDAIAKAAGTPGPLTRRAAMLSGDLGLATEAALVGGADALAAIGLTVGRGVQPMLAATAESVADAVAALGEVSVEWKLDGIRIQVHKSGSDVKIFTRNLNDVTTRVGDIVHIVRAFPADTLVLDGEVIGGQDAASSTLAPWFFDVLHLDGNDLIDAPLTERRQQLELVVVERMIPGEITSSPQAAEELLAQALASRHEGVMVKAADSPYLAGRRGKTWRKVKPVHTFDLVVLAIEWGHGRRTGKLSNLHLGAQKEWPTKFSLGKHSGSPTSPSSRTPSTITMS